MSHGVYLRDCVGDNYSSQEDDVALMFVSLAHLAECPPVMKTAT